MGVGRLMPLPSSHASTAGGNFMSAKCGTCTVNADSVTTSTHAIESVQRVAQKLRNVN
jgi:hypothetical protein